MDAALPLSRPRCRLAAALAAAVPAVSMAAPVRVELRPQVVVAAPEVRLGDVAFLATTDLATIRRLVELPLGHAPAPGAQAVLSRAALAQWIWRRAGIASGQVAWTGADQVRVSGAAQHYPAHRIEGAAQDALRQWLAGRAAASLSTALVPLRDDLRLPLGGVRLRVRPIQAHAVRGPLASVWVDVEVQGRVARSVPVQFTVDADEGTLAAPWRGVDVQDASTEKGLPAAAARGAGAGAAEPAAEHASPVAPRLPSRVPAIRRGSWVTLHLRSGAVELQTRVRALGDAAVGEPVRLQAGAASLEAQATGPARAEMQ